MPDESLWVPDHPLETALLNTPEMRCILNGCTCAHTVVDDPAVNAYWAAIGRLVVHYPAVGQEVLTHRYTPPVPATWVVNQFVSTILVRQMMLTRWSITITDPETVAFVAGHCGPRAYDPMAGTGWWAHLLTGAGVDVVASDLHLRPAASHHPIIEADAVTATTGWGNGGRTLILSWPTYTSSIASDVLQAYTGDRVVFIGELEGSCGDRRMRSLLGGVGWGMVAYHQPPTWPGFHDVVTVYRRATGYETTCYGKPVRGYPSYRVAKKALMQHIRTCPQGPMPWAKRIRFWQGVAGWATAAATGGWLDHTVRPVTD